MISSVSLPVHGFTPPVKFLVLLWVALLSHVPVQGPQGFQFPHDPSTETYSHINIILQITDIL